MEASFIMMLVMYNLHTIKLTHLKCTIQVIFSTLTELCNYQHEPILEHFHQPNEILLACLIEFPPPAQADTNLLCLYGFASSGYSI